MSGLLSPSRCPVEKKLDTVAQLELDALLADPSRWPKAIFEGWKVPKGTLPAAMRTWGAAMLGTKWCAERGIEVTIHQMQRHYEQHVPILPYSPDDVAVRAADHGSARQAVVPTTPTTYIEVYQKGLSIGARALDLMLAKVEAMVAADVPVPTDLLMQLGNLGVKLATSQAGIISRGFDMARQKDEEMAGFREGATPVSPRFGDARVRVIEGEARPVTDAGRADRREYNKRAVEEGSPRLPA